ncbi:uncharacterized protein LOC126893592 isoform X2 [Daktulosphaira vitifoliae]|nr:uncharacterized protein LOC126893592 isoform X2 [Daktulosphaira vitifoliae]
MFEMDLEELKDEILDDVEPGLNLSIRSQIMYNDLYCGDLYNFLYYTELIQSLIEHNSTYEKDEFNNLLLNESIIQQMIAVKLKIHLTKFLQPYWIMYMFAIYLKNQTMDNKLSVKLDVMEILEKLKKYLLLYTTKYCRKNNKYNLSAKLYKERYVRIQLEEKMKISMIQDVMTVMVNRNNINNILLNGEEVEDWVSLRKIYLYEIIQNTDILKTIIKDFGEQSEKSYNNIINDIYRAYEAARNYYWFDVWISKIRVYHDKIFNIFRVVILHLIRKHLMYLTNKDETIAFDYNNQMHEFLKRNMYTFNLLFRQFTEFNSSLLHKPSSRYSITYDDVNSGLIGKVERIIEKTHFVESFEILRLEVDNKQYNMDSIKKTKKLMKLVQFSEKKEEEIRNFQNISDIKGLNDNFERFNIFLEYFINIFKHKLSVFWSFKQFSDEYKKTNYREPQETEKERLLYLYYFY